MRHEDIHEDLTACHSARVVTAKPGDVLQGGRETASSVDSGEELCTVETGLSEDETGPVSLNTLGGRQQWRPRPHVQEQEPADGEAQAGARKGLPEGQGEGGVLCGMVP